MDRADSRLFELAQGVVEAAARGSAPAIRPTSAVVLPAPAAASTISVASKSVRIRTRARASASSAGGAPSAAS
jgi:hypothetical protein